MKKKHHRQQQQPAKKLNVFMLNRTLCVYNLSLRRPICSKYLKLFRFFSVFNYVRRSTHTPTLLQKRNRSVTICVCKKLRRNNINFSSAQKMIWLISSSASSSFSFPSSFGNYLSVSVTFYVGMLATIILFRILKL